MAAEMGYDDEEESYASPYGGVAPLALMGQQYSTPEAHQYARKILNRTIDQPQGTEEADYFKKLETQAETARRALRNARERIAAQEYGNTEAWLAAAAGFGAPTRTGSFGETLGNVSGNLIEPIRRKREFNHGRDKQLLDIDLGMAGIDERLTDKQLALMMARMDREAKLAGESLKVIGRPIQSSMDKNQQAGRQAVDKAYAQEYVDFTQQGATSAVKSLDDLKKAQQVLSGEFIDPETGKVTKVRRRDDITGPIIGTVGKIPWVGEWLQNIAFPESADVRQLVEYTIQQSLRPILGAQFTRDEGERLIARVYNPLLEEKYNAARLNAMIQQLERAYREKVAAKEYWETYGTLGPTRDNPQGFRGRVNWDSATVDDLLPPGSLPGDDVLEGRGDSGDESDDGQSQGFLPPVEELPEIDLEDIWPAGTPMPKLRKAEGGAVEDDRMGYEMPDGRVVRAPRGTPYEDVLQRYEAASGKPMADLARLMPTADESEPEFEMHPSTAVGLAGSAVGQGILGAAGARYGTKLSHLAADMIPGHKMSPAQGRVLRGLENEGLSPSDWVKLVNQAQKLGVPVTGMDVGGFDLRALGESAMHPENPETRQVYQDMVSRQAGSRARVDDQINRALKPDDYFKTEKKLQKELRANAKPLYTELNQKYPFLKSESLMQLMNTPSGKKAVKAATKAIRDRPGATLGKADAMGMITKPSIEFLDQVKDELDDMINNEEMSGGEYKATKKGRRLRDLRNALRNEVDLLTTDPKTGVSAYKTARAQYAGDLEIRDALRFGRYEFMKLAPGELEEKIKEMDFTQKDAFRTGVAQALFEKTGKTGRRVNPADRVIDSPEMQEKLKLLFDKPKEYEIFKQALETEMKMFDDSKSTISRGKAVLSKPQSGEGVLTRTAKEAPTLGILNPVQWALRYFRRKPELGKKESAEILRILKTNDPAELKKLERTLTPKVGRAAARKSRVGKATAAGAALGAALPFAREWLGAEEDGESDEPVTGYARGGLVRRKPDWEKITQQVLNQSMFGADDILSTLEARSE